MPPVGRRELLELGAGGLSVAAASFLAGCNVLDRSDRRRRANYDVPERTTSAASPDPAGVTFGPVSPPATGAPTYRRWLPAPTEFVGDPPDGELEGGGSYSVQWVDLDWIRAHRPAVPAGFARGRGLAKLGLDHFGVGVENYRQVIRMNRRRAVVLEGEVDPFGVRETLVDAGYQFDGTYRGYWLFSRPDDPRAVGVGDDALVFSDPGRRPGEPVGVVRTVVDARTGEIDRYHERDGGFGWLSRATGRPPVGLLWNTDVWERPRSTLPDLDGVVGSGRTVTFDESATYVGLAFAFDRRRTPSSVEGKLRRIASVSERLRAASTVEVTVDGRMATVVGSIDDDRYSERFGVPDAVRYPKVTWSFDHERRDDGIAVRAIHEAGDEIPVEELEARLAGRDGSEGAFAFDGRVVGPGDTLTVAVPTDGVSRAYTLRLFWRSSAGPYATILGKYEFGPRG